MTLNIEHRLLPIIPNWPVQNDKYSTSLSHLKIECVGLFKRLSTKRPETLKRKRYQKDHIHSTKFFKSGKILKHFPLTLSNILYKVIPSLEYLLAVFLANYAT